MSVLKIQITAIKEIARQISELSQEDYITLANCYPPYSSSNDVSVDIYEPIAIQLAELIDRVRVEGQGAVNSDSGHLSDYDSCETDEQKSESNSLVTLCGEDISLDEPLLGNHQSVFEETMVLKDTKIGTVNASEFVADGNSNQSSKKMLPPEEKIGAFLSKVAEKVGSQDGEDIHSDKAEIFTVTELEKEFFSDSSEEISPEKATPTLPSPQEDQHRSKAMPHRLKEKRDLPTAEGGRSEDSKWHHQEYHDTSYHHSHGWNKRYNKRGSFNSNYRRSRGGHRLCHQGREERYRIKEVSNICEAQSESWTPKKPKESEVRVSYREKLIATAESKKETTTAPSKGGKIFPTENTREKHTSESKREKHTTSATEKREKPTPSAKGERHTIGTAAAGAAVENHQLLPESAEKKTKHSAPVHYQPSPLVVHSQNMWSSNIEAIKSSCCKKSVLPLKQSKNSNSTDLFNHFEVGSFLMEGKNAQPIKLNT